LNEEQSRAVLSKSKITLMLAGAGTGKTKTLTHRIAHLNLNCRVGTSGILAITFTRAAAKEMKDRLGKLIGEKESKKIACSTFHALAVHILKEWGHRLGLDKNFTVYTQEDRAEVLSSIITAMGLTNQTSVNKVLAKMDKSPSPGSELLVLREYDWQLKRYNAVDLDHLIRKVNELFIKHPNVSEFYRKQWKYVFVDEFQDTDNEQLQFIKLLAPDNLFVIGDDFQAIYGWRGARVENILEFPKEFSGADVIKLEQNYRSTQPIIQAANSLIGHNVNQTEKTLIGHKEGSPLDLFVLSSQDAEAEMVGGLISSKGMDEKYSDFAVLARTNAHIDFMYHKLRSKNIPCMVLSGANDPLKKMDIRMIFSYLVSIYNPKDEKNFKRSLQFPNQLLSDIQMKQLEQVSIDNSVSLRDSLWISTDEKLLNVRNRYDDLSNYVLSTESILAAFKVLTDLLGIREWYTERSLFNRIAELNEAEQYIAYWMERQINLGEDTDTPTFLKWFGIRDIQEKLLDKRDTVKLMTIHGSKGLEFPTVFLIGMNEGTFPSRNTRDMEEERRLAYVAVTRAEKNLIVSTTRTSSGWGKTEECVPSRFIAEMGGNLDCLTDQVVWRQQAESCANYLRKGRLAAVEGRIQIRNYENNEGRRIYITEIVADNVRFLESANKESNSQQNRGDSSNGSGYGSGGGSGTNRDPYADDGHPINISDDDLPF
jgi:DNA helicase-2/ATP-dependent DNA helicase PcrA